jgi:uncharacterized DUF497 family protein
LEFDWDEANIRHLGRHGVSQQEAEQCYLNDPLVIEEQMIDGEERFLALGETNVARRLAFVFTVRDNRIRFVTAYPMSRKDQRLFEEHYLL